MEYPEHFQIPFPHNLKINSDEMDVGMDYGNAFKILSDRIQKIEPESVYEIVSFLVKQGLCGKDLILLTLAPDNVIEEKVQEAKLRLATIQASEYSLSIPRHYSSPIPISPNSYHQQVLNSDYTSFEEYSRLLNQTGGQFLTLDEIYYSDPANGAVNRRINRQTPSLPNFAVKTCHYFNRGYCKHGSNCRYIHVGGHLPRSLPDNFSRMFIDGDDSLGLSSGSLEKLETEITELLKSRRGNPVSIASLPMMYQDKYGRSLQAEGYLTESQRHGRAGYSLTKLLARLKNIRLFERPHGQHFVILAEDAVKYSLDNYHNDRKDPGPVVAGSRQIYLTFPAESTFTEEDVSNYFSSFGPVEDVRIPCQQKRMFGFVTFSCPNTVKMVLAKGNPHFVCGARVLVKPYREKSKLGERKSQYYQGSFWDMESEIHPRVFEAPRFLRRQIMEEQELAAVELETWHLSELKLMQKTVKGPTPYINHAMEKLNLSEEHAEFPSAECFNHWLDIFNNGSSSSDDPSVQAGSSYSYQESNQAINLPENPFALQLPSGISTAI